jgi:hypothetical protein
MVLSINEIQERLKSPLSKAAISKAIKHENRIKFHVESFTNPADISGPLTDFLEWVKLLIPKDKYYNFVQLFKFPTPNVQLTKKIFFELKRVFASKNPSYNYQFSDSEYADDWEWYRSNVLKEPGIWENTGWQTMKTAINSILIVDMPEDETATPEPYFYFLSIKDVVDFDYDKAKKEFRWIMFNQPGNRLACFDEEMYRVLQLDDNRKITEILVEKAHELGYCPARFFWSDELNTKEVESRESCLSPQLANLDWLLYFSISKRALDLYAGYPIYAGYERDCDFRNNETGDYCDGGFLRDVDRNYKVFRDGTIQKCPVCEQKSLAGAGSLIEMPIPNSGEFEIKDPVKIITIDRESLDYNVDEENRLRKEVFESVTGTGGNVQEKQSINEMQVTANFQSKINVLNSLKRNFESARKWVDDTICKLRYGEAFIDSSISLGTEYYIYTSEELYKQYELAKKNGASEAYLDQLQQQIIETEYQNDTQKMQRASILKHLEPYRHLTFNEMMNLNGKELLDNELLIIKINFSTFIDRFERENMNIIEFAFQIDFDKKINIITEKLKEYAREQQQPKKKEQNPEEKGGKGTSVFRTGD